MFKRPALRIVIILVAFTLPFLASPTIQAQETVHVDDDNCPGPGSGTTEDPYCKIQDAICDLKDASGGTVLVHPGSYNTATISALAAIPLKVEFIGKESHAAAHPEEGINALDAMILSFSAINTLKCKLEDNVRIHGIITDGGKAANIIPAHSAASFLVRAGSVKLLEDIKPKVLKCFSDAAKITGASMKFKWGDETYAPMRNNIPLAELYIQNMSSLGRDVALFEPSVSSGSTDMGNVSQVVPSIHPHVQITEEDISIHSAEFALAAASEAGTRAMLDAAKALAMTVVDLLASPDLLVKVKEEFINPEKE